MIPRHCLARKKLTWVSEYGSSGRSSFSRKTLCSKYAACALLRPSSWMSLMSMNLSTIRDPSISGGASTSAGPAR